MRKIGLILPNNIYLAPYAAKYAKMLNNAELTLIYWDRYGNVEKMNKVSLLRYQDYIDTANASQRQKLIHYIKFGRYAIKTCKKEKFDSIIVFQPILLFILFILGLGRIKTDIIVDIRDYTYEGSRLFVKVEDMLFKRCKKIIISSPYYKAFLPDGYEFLIMHNMNEVSEQLIQKCKIKNNQVSIPIKISFIGYVRFIKVNTSIIRCFSNDNRFQLFFEGKDSNRLRDYVEQNNIQNVFLTPQFDPNETENKFASADIILNMYGADAANLPYVKYALSNKLYYAAIFHKPIVVSPGTAMEKTVLDYGIGIALDENDENMAEKLYSYYCSINWEIFTENCEKFIKDLEKDNRDIENFLQNLCS